MREFSLTAYGQQLVSENMGLIGAVLKARPVSKRIWSLDRDELHQELSMALMWAAASFKPSLGWRFSTFATTVLHNWLTNLLRRRCMQNRVAMPMTSEDLRFTVSYSLPDLRVSESDLNELAEYVDWVQTKAQQTRDYDLVVARFFEQDTLQSLADAHGLSKERMRQRFDKAMDAIRREIGVDPSELPSRKYSRPAAMRRKTVRSSRRTHALTAMRSPLQAPRPEPTLSHMRAADHVSEAVALPA